MLKQCKYAMRLNLNQRLGALAGVLVLNVAVGIYGRFSDNRANFIYEVGIGWGVLSVIAMVLVCLVADIKVLNGMFNAPEGYLNMMVPAAPHKTVLGSVMAMLPLDFIGVFLSLWFVSLQSNIVLNQNSEWWIDFSHNRAELIMAFVAMILAYLLIMLWVILVRALAQTVFFKLPFKTLLGLAGAAVVAYVLSWLQMLLVPFGVLTRYKWMLTIHIQGIFTVGGILFFVVVLAIAAGMYLLACGLMKRRMNV